MKIETIKYREKRESKALISINFGILFEAN
jgi:hypothetical protein